MTRTRKEVRSLAPTWNDTMLWYAKAVGALQARPITDKTSWRYLAAMHGFNGPRWTQLGYLRQGEALPSGTEMGKYWNQCQHQSWYFLPWHRAYLLSFEDILRAAIANLQGPPDWALPYWNYSGTTISDATAIPNAFRQAELPDGSRNPLFVQARYGTGVDPQDADLTGRITESGFTNDDDTAQVGFGGPRTPFSWTGNEEGLIESQPHDLVHTDVGGRSGIMSDPRTAALDPIFWLHHANIDRLWEVWLRRDLEGNRNPADADWRNGPSDRAFAIFGPDGKNRPCRPSDVQELTALGYDYDDISDPLPGVSRRQSRLLALAPRAKVLSITEPEARPMSGARKGEVLGSNDQSLALGPEPVTAQIRLAPQPLSTFIESFTPSTMRHDTPDEPDRVFLKLENIRGLEDAATFDVFVHGAGAPAGQGTKVGSFSLFGVGQASQPDGTHGGTGLTKTFEITKAMDHLGPGSARPEALDVRIVPRVGVAGEHDTTVGQITIHRVSGR